MDMIRSFEECQVERNKDILNLKKNVNMKKLTDCNDHS